jgi:hypothetical protein
MPKLSLPTITAKYASTAALNTAFDAVEAAVEKTLSRDGTSPNEMLADLDLNSNNIINSGVVHTDRLVLGGIEVEATDGVSTAVSTLTNFDYIATGGQTTFSTAPLTPTADSVIVSVNGLVLPSTDITISTTNVVIPATSLNDEVSIKLFTRDVTATTPTATNTTYTPTFTGSVSRVIRDKLDEFVSVKDFGALGDGVTDDTAAIQAALDAGLGPVKFPVGIYCVSDEIVIPDGGGIIGANAFWKTRTGYTYDGGSYTVIKYIGAGGANTCVVRASQKEVGVIGTDFVAAGGTDDLINIQLKDFHVDCNNLADFGVYLYRVGYNNIVDRITCEKAVEANHVHLGCFGASFGIFGAYESADRGVDVGIDLFGWASAEATCFAYSAAFKCSNNGTGATYPGDDLACAGARIRVGRGSTVKLTCESNVGRAAILSQYNISTGGGGPVDYILEYIEGNGDGPYIDTLPSNGIMRIRDGFIHPGNGGSLAPQNITIEAKTDAGVVTTDEGPTDSSRWLSLERLIGSSSIPTNFDVISNTNKYAMRGCSRNVGFTNRKPNIDDYVATNTQVAASCWFTAAASPTVWHAVNGTLARSSAGVYTFTYTRPFRTAAVYTPQATVSVSAALDTQVRVTNHNISSIVVTTYNAAGVAADTGDRISITVSGLLEYQP